VKNPWEKPLHIEAKDIAAWEAEAPANVPLLVWALTERKIDFQKYAQWAMNHYELPLLKSEFFTKNPTSNLIDQMESSPWMVPLGSWEGLTYVGCVVPPPDGEPGLVYVLADPLDLKRLYDSHFEVIEDVADHEAEEAIEEILEPPSLPENDSPVEMDAPQGLVLNLSSETAPDSPAPIDLLSEEDLKEPHSQEDEEVTVFEAPEGLSFDEIPSAPSSEAEEVLSETSLPEVPEGMNLEAEEHVTSEEDLVEEEPAEPTVAAEIPEDQCFSDSESEIPIEFWEQVKESFSHAALFHNEGDAFNLFWKDGAETSATSLPAQKPSLLRIAQRTQKPYFGFVVKNEVHDEIFKTWGMSDYPASVTAMSLELSSGSAILLLFGFLEENSEELSRAQELCEKLESHFKSSSEKAA